MPHFPTVFQSLDRWRHYPSYQLERRADIFFSLYLRGAVEELLGVELEEEMIPELPVKRDLIWPERPTHESVKVDYALFARDRSRVVFVELKTDAGSRREAQDHYLERLRVVGLTGVLEGLCAIARHTTAHQKYHHLFAALARLGLVSVPTDLEDYLYPAPRPGLSRRLSEIAPRALSPEPAVEIVYVQPEKTEGDRCIDFATFAAFVERSADPLSAAFAAALRRWTAPAGAAPPR